jgi:hypothetical protein
MNLNNRDNSVDNSQGGGKALQLFKDDPLKPLTSLGGAALTPQSNDPFGGMSQGGGRIGGGGIPSLYGIADPVRKPETFAEKKKREEIERLERELAQEREKAVKSEAEHNRHINELKEKNKRDLQTIEDSQKSMISMIIQEKEKTMEAH